MFLRLLEDVIGTDKEMKRTVGGERTPKRSYLDARRRM